jgi:hypothetical protein
MDKSQRSDIERRDCCSRDYEVLAGIAHAHDRSRHQAEGLGTATISAAFPGYNRHTVTDRGSRFRRCERASPSISCAMLAGPGLLCRPDPNSLRNDRPQLPMGTLADEHTNMVQCHAGFSLIVKHERRLDRIQGGRDRDNVTLRVNHSNDW